ncbi:thermonuclease family protein [Flaviflagellibacter deserti]|uniref:Thermonuclease family protein n=1 Tax=Flaviflagellibacter deserti TaxID=2267266 RepID=A0ABV9Z2S4_9HYPH
MSFSICGPGSAPTCVVDGDTFRLNGERMRIESIDTPEIHTNLCGGQREIGLGRKAGLRLAELLNSGPLAVTRTGHDRYGRTLVLVRAGGRDLGEVLIGEGLARRWPDGDEFWCR